MEISIAADQYEAQVVGASEEGFKQSLGSSL